MKIRAVHITATIFWLFHKTFTESNTVLIFLFNLCDCV